MQIYVSTANYFRLSLHDSTSTMNSLVVISVFVDAQAMIKGSRGKCVAYLLTSYVEQSVAVLLRRYIGVKIIRLFSCVTNCRQPSEDVQMNRR